ncbi:DHH family phosphoesterase [Colwellia sp. D2M02]|uniref:DHH family phosphoesterase n=1 Tax=Colwellia asteriadis TaxID=517723 RepID=A0ABN1L9T7_9GAMM|nr:DHH family phosphoesterase [Colwellia sp. D2M02]MBU2892076.1 DHH family phosphoesterase [Colwellia sp. D2M02]
MHYDVFNGDADGIIALLQLRLAQPKESKLITGVKRDISLLKQVCAVSKADKASSVTVLDISLEKNIDALTTLLNDGVEVFYADHHRTGDIPQAALFTGLFDTDANVCTSLIVNQYLDNRYVFWAIAAAFGDNMQSSARTLAKKYGLSDEEQLQLNELGIYINYNGYGSSTDDLHFHPANLFKALLKYPNPFDLINEKGSVFSQLKNAYLADMAKAKSAKVIVDEPAVKAVLLDDEPWARRVSGVFGNELANQSPGRAHAVLTLNKPSSENPLNEKSYTVSLRAPLNNKQGAGDVCAKFPTGGGRAAAAGVNELPEAQLEAFIASVAEYYQ